MSGLGLKNITMGVRITGQKLGIAQKRFYQYIALGPQSLEPGVLSSLPIGLLRPDYQSKRRLKISILLD